ncbi:MAG: ABC transporter permease subunit, partial [Gaiellales bacterium]
LQTITEVILPSALPEMMTGLRVALGVTFTTIVAAETVNGLPGIGGMVRDAQRYNKTDVVVLGIIVIGIVAVVLDIAIRALDRRVVPWRGRA